MKQRGLLYFLPDNISFAEVPGLEREMRKHITMDMVRRIAKAGADGRILAVNTTNLDTGTSRVFDLVGGSAARRRLGTARPHSQHHARLGGDPRRVSVPDHRR